MEMKMMVLVVVVLVAMVEGCVAVSLCNMTQDDLETCKPAVTNPDPVPPSPECCKALAGADLPCLCSYRNSMMLPALGIDPDLAMALPQKCNLPTPSACT